MSVLCGQLRMTLVMMSLAEHEKAFQFVNKMTDEVTRQLEQRSF